MPAGTDRHGRCHAAPNAESGAVLSLWGSRPREHYGTPGKWRYLAASGEHTPWPVPEVRGLKETVSIVAVPRGDVK